MLKADSDESPIQRVYTSVDFMGKNRLKIVSGFKSIKPTSLKTHESFKILSPMKAEQSTPMTASSTNVFHP